MSGRIQEDVARLANVLATLKPVLPPVSVPCVRHHAGALLADVALQAGVNYATVVRPRVESILQRFPSATTVSAFGQLVDQLSVQRVLGWNHPEKGSRFTALLRLCLLKGLDTVTDIADWVQLATARDELLMLRGIGKKSVDYMRALCGHETIPVDRHWIRLVALAGVTSREYDYTRMVIERACHEVGLPLLVADRGIWLLSQSC